MIDRPNSTLAYTEYLSGGLNTVTKYVKKISYGCRKKGKLRAVTYTLISCGGCLCWATSSHPGT